MLRRGGSGRIGDTSKVLFRRSDIDDMCFEPEVAQSNNSTVNTKSVQSNHFEFDIISCFNLPTRSTIKEVRIMHVFFYFSAYRIVWVTSNYHHWCH